MSKKLLLINPSVFSVNDGIWGQPLDISPQLLILYSFLKKYGIKVEVLDLELELGRPCSPEDMRNFNKKARELISKYDFDVVGISCFASFNYLASIQVAKICRRLNPHCLIVVGGYHPTARPNDFIFPEDNLFDYIVRGEGESSLLEICKNNKLSNKRPNIINGLPTDLNGNMNLDWQGYKYTKSNLSIDLYFARGCPYKCAYCAEYLKNNLGFKYRTVTIERAIKEIKRIIRIINPRIIRICDATFGLDKKWRRNFLNALIKEKINKVFWAESRIDVMDKADIDLLSRLNFQLDFGLESCSKKMLLAMRKTNNPLQYLEKTKVIIDYANEKGCYHSIYLMFNHPGETNETVKESLDFLRKILLKRNNIFSRIKAQNYFFIPGSQIDLNFKYYRERFGTIIREPRWWTKVYGQHSSATNIIPNRNLERRVEWEHLFYKLLDDCEDRYSPQAALWDLWVSKDSKKNLYYKEVDV